MTIKVYLVKAMVFPVGMYGCESWTVKKAECRRIDAFELWCWRKLLRVPWIARRSNQSLLNEIILGVHGKDWCWHSNTLATSCEELTHWKRPWCRERLQAAGEGNDRGWDGWKASPTPWAWVWVNSRSWWWTGKPGVLQSMELQRVGHDWMTELNWNLCVYCLRTNIYLHKYSTIIKIRSLSQIPYYPLIYRYSALPVIPIMSLTWKKEKSFLLVQDSIQTDKLHSVLQPI